MECTVNQFKHGSGYPCNPEGHRFFNRAAPRCLQEFIDYVPRKNRFPLADEINVAGKIGMFLQLICCQDMRIRGIIDEGGIDKVFAITDLFYFLALATSRVRI